MAPLDGDVRSTQATGSRTKPHRRRFPRWLVALGVLALAIVLLVVFWDWNWFRPLVEAQASSYLGRKVTVRNLDVKLGWSSQIILDGVTVANPDGFPADSHLATADRLAVTLDAKAYLHNRQIVIPSIAIAKPVIDAEQLADGRATWDLKLPQSSGNAGPPPKIGDLEITDGHAHVVVPKLKADFQLAIATQPAADGHDSQIVVDANGSYAQQPVAGRLIGGAVLSLRDKGKPYPVNMQLANGPTHVKLDGTIQDPLAFSGANIKLDLSGPDMALLKPLTGIPLPSTPSYNVAGNLDYADKQIRFHEFKGRVGSSDIGGTIGVDPGGVGSSPARQVVNADLTSHKVDLADLGGFIGSQPGRLNTPGQTPAQRAAVAHAEASTQLLPTKQISLPTLKAADIHLRYHADSIAGRSIPLDNLTAKLDIVDGRITVSPLNFGIGHGQIASDIDLTPTSATEFHTKADIKVQRVDLGRVLAATHLVRGGGLIGGQADIDSTGSSVSTIVGHGNGNLKLFMSGGNLSALLVDLVGLQVGNAVLSALGIPQRATLQCFVTDFALRRGVLESRTMILDTSEAVVNGAGSIDLGRESLDYTLRTEAKHFTVGSLPTPINIRGSFKNPSIRPAVGPLAARTGAAIGLGILFPPAALLPTIQFGVGNNTGCTQIARIDGARVAASKANAGAAPKAAAAGK